MSFSEYIALDSVLPGDPAGDIMRHCEDISAHLRQVSLAGAWEGPLAQGANQRLTQLRVDLDTLRAEARALVLASQHEREAKEVRDCRIALLMSGQYAPDLGGLVTGVARHG